MTDTEKITINMSVVDLGKIDLLVEQGHFSSRSDLIRTAIRDKLAEYQDTMQKEISRQDLNVGVTMYPKSDLEKWLQKGLQKDITVVGMMLLPNDVTPELARATIKSLRVYGVLRATQAVKDALADRMM
jgi:Arc/MetJ-type ribon-helix-helix transcriptional regulator